MCLLLSPWRQLEKDRDEQRGGGVGISWPHATVPPLYLPWRSPISPAVGQSGPTCSVQTSLEDIRLLGETPSANRECATWQRDTCSRSMRLGHVSVEPHATRLWSKERQRAAAVTPERRKPLQTPCCSCRRHLYHYLFTRKKQGSNRDSHKKH